MAATVRASASTARRAVSSPSGGVSGAGRSATARAATSGAAATRPASSRPAASRPAARPSLQVVPVRRRAVRWALVGLGGLFAVLFAVTAFQTRIAENQLDLDRLDDRIAVQRETFTRLRLERATLMAPDRLMAEASALGMEPGGETVFVTISPDVVAQVAVSASGVPQRSRQTHVDRLDEYGAVKALMDGVNDTSGAE